MSEQQMRQVIEYASGFAETAFAKQGVLYPMWHCVAASGESFITPPPSPNKDVGVMLMRALFELKDVVRYVYIDEAWTVLSAVKDVDLRKGIRNHPDRVEIVMFSGEDHECGQMMAFRKIIRPQSGKPSLGPLEWMSKEIDRIAGERGGRGGRGVEHQGRMIGLLPVRGTRQ